MNAKAAERSEVASSPSEAAVRAVCPDWAELSEHQRERTREIFAAGAAWGRRNFATEVTENTEGERK